MTADRFHVHPKIVSETIDGEVIILNLDRGRYYSLTQAGAEVWASLARSATAQEIVAELLEQYDGPEGDVSRAVQHLLEELRREELIQTAEPGSARPAGNGHRPAPAGARRPFQPPVLQAYTDMEDLLLLDPIHEVDESGWPNRP